MADVPHFEMQKKKILNVSENGHQWLIKVIANQSNEQYKLYYFNLSK